jgi:hypothetical protein
MADQLYLSLWYPNFRLDALPAALTGVLKQFARIAQSDVPDNAKPGETKDDLGRVAVATAYPLDWTESPTYQRIYVNDKRADDTDDTPDTRASVIDDAVAEATGQLHDDTAYEFEMRWLLWLPNPNGKKTEDEDTTWTQQPWRVKITGFGPEFDKGSFEQNGHIRVDFGLDTPWVLEDGSLPEVEARTAAEKIRQNVEKLLAFTLSVEKHCGISSRLLWTESGEPLAEKLIATLQRLN